MTSEDIIKYINEPESLNRDSFARLKVFIEKYPYFQAARMLIMRNIKELEPKSLNKYLSENTIYISDRRRIYSYLHPKQLEETLLSEKEEVQKTPPETIQNTQTPIAEEEIEKTTPPTVADAAEQKTEIKEKDKLVTEEDKNKEKEDPHFHDKIVNDFFKEKTLEHAVIEEVAQKEGKDTTFKIEVKRRKSRNTKKTQRVKVVKENKEVQKEIIPKKKIVLNKKSKEKKPIQKEKITEVIPQKKAVVTEKIKGRKIEQKQEVIPPQNIESNKKEIDAKLAKNGSVEELPSSKKVVLNKKKKIAIAKKSAISNDVFGKVASLQGISLKTEKRKQQKEILELQQKQIDTEQQKIDEQRKEAAVKIKDDEIKAKSDIAKVNEQAKLALQEKLVKQKEAEQETLVKQKAVAQEELHKQKIEEQKNVEEEKLRKEKEAEKLKAVEQEKLRQQKEAEEQEKLQKKKETLKESAADALIRRISERKNKKPEKTKKSLIDNFIKNEPKIDRNNELKNSGDLSIESTQDQGTIVSETLANLLVNQKEYDKAIEAFHKLAEQKPLKKDYFEQRIQEIAKLMSEK